MNFPINFNNNVLTVPSVKDRLETSVADVKKLAEATWAQAQKMAIETKNQMTNKMPIGLEQLNILIDNVGEQAKTLIETKVDNWVYSESGYHLEELNNMMSEGRRIWDVLKQMESTEKLPEPEWVVNMANTLFNISKTNNPRIIEVKNHINGLWKQYNDSKDKLNILNEYGQSILHPDISTDLNLDISTDLNLDISVNLNLIDINQNIENIKNTANDDVSILKNTFNESVNDIVNQSKDSYGSIETLGLSSYETLKKDSSAYINSVIEQGKSQYARWKQDASMYGNLFKNKNELKKFIWDMLEAWLSDQSQILVNVFMINRFKELIENIRQTARQGFKRDADAFTQINSAISIFQGIKDLIYTVQSIPVADSWSDMISADTSKIESLIDTGKNIVNNVTNTVLSSVENTITKLKNNSRIFVHSMDMFQDILEDRISGTIDNLSNLKDNVTHFLSDEVLNNITDTVNDIILNFVDELNLEMDQIKNVLDIKKIGQSIQSSVKIKIEKAVKDKNPDILSELQDSSISNNNSATISIFDYNINIQADLSGINFKEILETTLQEEVSNALNFAADQLGIVENTITNTIDSATGMATDEIDYLHNSASDIITASTNQVTDTIGLINNSKDVILDNANNISNSIFTAVGGLTSISEEIIEIDNLLPSISFKAPPFINIFIKWLDILTPILNILEMLVNNYRTNKAMTREAAFEKIAKLDSLKKIKEGFQIWDVKAELKNLKDTADILFAKENIMNDLDNIESQDQERILLTEKGSDLIRSYLNEDGVGQVALFLNEDGRFEVEQNAVTKQIFIKDKEEVLPATPSYVLENMGNAEMIPFYDEDDNTIITREMMYPELGTDDLMHEDWEYLQNATDEESIAIKHDLELEKQNKEKLEKIKDLRSAIKYKTDEFEGQQVINLENIDLCSNNNLLNFYNPELPYPGIPYDYPTEISKIENQPVILEFARETLNDDGIDFKLLVSPGDKIQENQNLAIISKGTKSAIVKSIFKSGYIRKDNETNDFIHAYNNERNIVIDNPEYARNIIDREYIEEIENNFKEEAELYDLITKYLIYSVYPTILLNSESKEATLAKGFLIPANVLPTGKSIYDKLTEHFEKTEDNYHEELLGVRKPSKKEAKRMGQKMADKIISVKGNAEKIHEIAMDQINKRQKYISGEHLWDESKWGIIDLYENYIDHNEYYSKCRIIDNSLADLRNHLGVSYYLDLYKNIYLDENAEHWIPEYKRLLEDIINYRRNIEGETYETLIKILNSEAFSSSAENKLEDIKDNNLWKYLEEKWPDEIIPDYEDFKAFLMDKISSDDISESFMSRLYNIYYYIKYNTDEVIMELDYDESDKDNIDNLLHKEENLLKEFWSKAIEKYKELELSKQIEELQEHEAVAEWPDKMDIKLSGNRKSYDFYLFKNQFKEPTVILPDEDMTAEIGNLSWDIDDFIPDVSSASDDFKEVDTHDENTEVDTTNIKYWIRWCSMATLMNCVLGPMAWSTGMIVKAFFIQFPCILIPFKVINIKFVKMTVVIGLAIRLIDIKPMIIYVNQYNEANNINMAVTAALEKVKAEYTKYVSYLEKINLNWVQVLINKLEQNNTNLLKEISELEIQGNELKTFVPSDWSDLKRDINDMIGVNEIFQNVYRIKNYPKDSDFNRNLHLSIGEGTIFGNHEFNIDMSEFTPIADIENELRGIQDNK